MSRWAVAERVVFAAIIIAAIVAFLLPVPH
jgi:hypothetical protein